MSEEKFSLEMSEEKFSLVMGVVRVCRMDGLSGNQFNELCNVMKVCYESESHAGKNDNVGVLCACSKLMQVCCK